MTGKTKTFSDFADSQASSSSMEMTLGTVYLLRSYVEAGHLNLNILHCVKRMAKSMSFLSEYSIYNVILDSGYKKKMISDICAVRATL